MTKARTEVDGREPTQTSSDYTGSVIKCCLSYKPARGVATQRDREMHLIPFRAVTVVISSREWRGYREPPRLTIYNSLLNRISRLSHSSSYLFWEEYFVK